MRAKEILQAIWKKYGVSLLMLTVAIALAVAEIVYSDTVAEGQTYGVLHFTEWEFVYLLPIGYCAAIIFLIVTRKKRQRFDYVVFAFIAASQIATFVEFMCYNGWYTPDMYFKIIDHNPIVYHIGYFGGGKLVNTYLVVSITLIVPLAILAVMLPFIIKDLIRGRIKLPTADAR